MYGKAYFSMYEGSLVGSGPVVFAVWGYVIAKTIKSRCELNAKVVAAILGCTPEEVEAAIKYLCLADPNSRSKEYEGRRMVQEGQYQYFIPTWETYNKMKCEEDRREYNRSAQQKHRDKLKEIAGRGNSPSRIDDQHPV
jgi:hypothetical protein